MTQEIKVNDKIKWKTKTIGFAHGTVVDVFDEDSIRVNPMGYTSAGGGLRKPNSYFIKKVNVVEVNGVKYEHSTTKN